ncbi:MAG: hypothetical protein NTZ16_11620 [Verrucomicrobia bacterium]|nr:hypothetical protein [Verrucomicrobiota bacterium]
MKTQAATAKIQRVGAGVVTVRQTIGKFRDAPHGSGTTSRGYFVRSRFLGSLRRGRIVDWLTLWLVLAPVFGKRAGIEPQHPQKQARHHQICRHHRGGLPYDMERHGFASFLLEWSSATVIFVLFRTKN